MAIISCRRKNNSLCVAFGPDTSIRFSARIKSALAKISAMPIESYHMDLSQVDDTDISFIQLLIAFSQKLKKQNRKMFLLNLPGGSKFISAALECGVDVHSLFEIEDG